MRGVFQRDKSQIVVLTSNGRRVGQKIATISVPSFAIGAAVPVSQLEGNVGSVAYRFPVTRSVRLDVAATVAWAVSGSGGNPTNSADFTGAISGTVSFAPGETIKTIIVYVKGDIAVEPDEGFVVTLSNPSMGTIALASSIATILNDDTVGGGGGGFSLTCSPGSFVLTGRVMTPRSSRKLSAVKGAFSLAGQSIGFVGSPALPFDTRYGTATATNGDITFGLRGVCRRIWVDSVNGNDANDGLSAATAKASWNAGWTLWSNNGAGGGGTGPGDQLMVGGGQGQIYTDTVSGNLTNFPGYDATYPNAILSYDSRTPADATKYGHLVEGDMPIVKSSGQSMSKSGGNNGYLAVQGLALEGLTSTSGCYINIVFNSASGAGGSPGHVWQNLRLNRSGITLVPNVNTNTVALNNPGAHMSKISMWNGAGIYAESMDSLWVSDFIAVHNGWTIGAVREDDYPHGGALVFTHHFYLHASCTNLQVHRIVAVDGSIGGVDPRGDVAAASLWVSIDNPTGITGGHFSNSYLERPDGARLTLDDAVICGGDKVTIYNPGGAAPGSTTMTWNNNRPGSRATNVAVFDNPNRGGSDGRYVGVERTDAGQIEQYMLLDKWSAWDAQTVENTHLGADMAHAHLSWSNSTLEMVPVGWNGTVTNCSQRLSAPAGYKNRAQTWVAVGGYSSKAAMVNDMLWNPTLKWAQRIASISLPAMGLTPSFGTIGAQTVGSTAPLVYPLALADLSLSRTSFTRGQPAVAKITGLSANGKLSSTDLPSGFSMDEFALFYQTGATTAGSNQITGVSSTAGVAPGMWVQGRDENNFHAQVFGVDAYVVSVVGSTVTVSENANATTSNISMDFWGGGRVIRYDGSGSGSASLTFHVTETSKDTLGARTTTFTVSLAVPDVTAPVLSSPVGTKTGTTTATIGATTDEGNGTLYGVVTTSSTPPTATQVRNGQNNAGTAAAFAGSVVVSSTGAKTLNAAGLAAGTAYYAHLMHEDASGNRSNVVSSAQFTTDAISGSTWGAHSSWWGLSGGSLTATHNNAVGGSGTRDWVFTTAAKVNGTVIMTPTALSATSYPSFLMVGLKTDNSNTSSLTIPGFDSDGSSLAYYQNGDIVYHGGNTGTVASWTAADALKFVKTGSSVAVYKNNVLQATIDTTAYGTGNLSGAAYGFASSTFSSDGDVVVLDGSGW